MDFQDDNSRKALFLVAALMHAESLKTGGPFAATVDAVRIRLAEGASPLEAIQSIDEAMLRFQQ